MISGLRAFQGDSAMEAMNAILKEDLGNFCRGRSSLFRARARCVREDEAITIARSTENAPAPRNIRNAAIASVCGADSVASALHLRSGATPRGPSQTIMTLRAGRQKAELLILHKTGTSHFALTRKCLSIDFIPGIC